MSMDNFFSFLQQILTMVDPESTASMEMAKEALASVAKLAEASGKVEKNTLSYMRDAEADFEQLVWDREIFIGKPGAYKQNQIKREKLRYYMDCFYQN